MSGYRTRDRGAFTEVTEVARGVGAAMLVPCAVLERVGLLDQELFLHYEDVEWSLRMRRAGSHLTRAIGESLAQGLGGLGR
jgi:GT2 family glycosyltransferase